MRVIILAAGEGYQIGGFNKLLLRRPDSGETIMDQYKRLFAGSPITVVVGYQAVNIMNTYPTLDYVYNPIWHTTQDSYSLALALSDEPCFVVHTDLFIMDSVIDAMEAAEPNVILAASKENRGRTDVNIAMNERRIVDIYPGSLRDPADVQPLDIYKICDRQLLRIWKRRCKENPHGYSVLNLPIDQETPVHVVPTELANVVQIKTPLDYANFLRRTREERDTRS
ncbi:NTP transferase domain-containing protein [Candidatus Bipolaricaulota bacterium]|nr:NTP transferase domain-containing protein [Candidatus Bipolaricaulota bacterium]